MIMYDVNEGFDAYKIYLALKQHFTGDYDFFKYNGNIKANTNSFLKRKDRFFFRKLSKKYERNELIDYFVSNFILNDTWIGNLLSQESENNYVEWKKRNESLTYVFRGDLLTIRDYCDIRSIPYNDLLVVQQGHPPLLKLILQKKITLESFIILDDILRFTRHWNKKLDDIVWEETRARMTNYKSFVKFNKMEMRKIVKEILSE
jgi:hypothetical protein